MIVRVFDRYEIRPTTGGLDYSIYEYREIKQARSNRGNKTRKSGEKDWVHIGKYCSSIPAGVKTIYEKELRKTGEVHEDLESAIDSMERISANLVKSIKVVDK